MMRERRPLRIVAGNSQSKPEKGRPKRTCDVCHTDACANGFGLRSRIDRLVENWVALS